MIIITEIKQVSGLSVTSPIYPDGILVDLNSLDSKTYSSSEVYFNVGNTGNIPLNVTASAEVLYFENWRNNFTISFNKPHIVLQPNETFHFIPTIVFNIELANNYSIHFIFRGLKSNNGTISVAEAHGKQLNFRILTDLIGHKLTIRTTDQGDWERRSNIKIWYGGNEEQGRGYTIFKELKNVPSYSSIVLEGWYQITARIYDDSSDEVKKYVRVNETKKVNIVYKLVTMYILIDLPESYKDPLNFTYFVQNDYISLSNVELVFQIFKRTGNESEPLFAITKPIIHPITNFHKGSLTSATNSFAGGWISGEHVFVGSIYVGNELYFEIRHELIFVFDWYEEFERSDLFLPALIILSLIVGGVTPIASYVIYMKLKNRKPKPNTNQNHNIELKDNE
jgi:hypothetical protein